MRSNPALKKIYNEYNKRWFGGKLPVAVKIYWGKDGECLGQVEYEGVVRRTNALQKYEKADIEIVLNKATRKFPRIFRTTILHECCHVKLLPNRHHGDKFQQEIRRLVRIGAYNDLL